MQDADGFDPAIGPDEDTIAAIATPAGAGGISVIRVSGPGAIGIVQKVVRLRSGKSVRKMRDWSIALGYAFDAFSGETVDEVVVLLMKGPRSYTTSDTLEVQCHGGRLVTEKILSLMISAGARLAGPGEFTRRAFLSGRITLDEAEAVLDMVTASSENALSEASRRLRGELGVLIRDWEERLLGVLAILQGGVDFPEDVDTGLDDVRQDMAVLECEIAEFLERSPLGLALAGGVEICLAGRPNVGKSSLFNALLSEERAIVTDIPGTTRDVLRERSQWSGIPVTLLDTAGLRTAREVIEAAGVERAESAAVQAEAIVYVVDDSEGMCPEDRKWLTRWRGKRILLAINKADLGVQRVTAAEAREAAGDSWVRVSALTGEGLQDLKDTVAGWFTRGVSREAVIPGSFRQVQCVRKASEGVSEALMRIDQGWTEDVVTVLLEEAAGALAELTGKKVSAETLDRIFSRFCVGK